MTASSVLNELLDLIEAPLNAARAEVLIAQAAEDVDGILNDGPTAWRVVLTVDGEEIVDSNDADGFVTLALVAYVQSNAGLDLLPGAGLTGTSTATPDPFLDRISYLIQLIRGAEIEDASVDCSLGRIFRFHRWEWYRIADLPAYRAARCEFEIRYALEDPAERRITEDGSLRLTEDDQQRVISA